MDTFTLKELKDIAKLHKDHHSIKNVAKMRRTELATELSKVFDIRDGQVHKKVKKVEVEGLGDRIKQALSHVRNLKQRMEGGKIAPPPKQIEPDYDKIPWEDIKWGSFTAQFKAYNAQHEKHIDDLEAFANYILQNPDHKDFTKKTKRRALFYLNVLK